jgi:ppGpp synthetase/RelA/SpoT-type nucleotidyltranferase
MPLTQQLIDGAVERYWREIDRYEKLAVYVGEACQQLLDIHGIRGLVQSRAKDPGRLRLKLQKYLVTGERAAEFVDLDSVFRVLKDLAGARVTTYVEGDRARVVALVQQRFRGFGADLTIIPDIKDQPAQLYRATHCQVRLKDEDAVGAYRNLKGLACEIQVCSQLAHVYNEIEHDLRYKPLSGTPSKKEHDLLNAFARLMEVGDTISNQLREALEARERDVSPGSAGWRRPEPLTRVRDRSALELVAHSPVLVEMARLLKASRPQDDLPATQAGFYDEGMRLLAMGAWSNGKTSAVTPCQVADELLDVLRPVAWRLFIQNPGATFERDTASEEIVQATGCDQRHAVKLMGQFVDFGFWSCSGQGSREEFCFRDPTFRDFLAASYLAGGINRARWPVARIVVRHPGAGWRKDRACDVLDANAFEPRWEPLVVFTAALLHDPLPLIDILADRKRDDLYRHRLGLVCRCYRGLSATGQVAVAKRQGSVFKDVLRIARRCAHDDAGHRMPWLGWVEMLLRAPDAAEQLCEGLLALDGRYSGWAVSLKVLKVFEGVLPQGRVPAPVVAAIAEHATRDEYQWRVNTALLALSVAEGEQQQAIVERYARMIEAPETPYEVKIRLAEAVATAGDTTIARRAGEVVLALAQDGDLAFKHRAQAVDALVSLLRTSHSSVATALLVDHFLNPSSEQHFWLAWRVIGEAEKDAASAWSAPLLAVTLFADREDDQRLRLWSAQVLANRPEPSLRDLGLRMLWGLAQRMESHAWVYAARWLVEHGPLELAKQARHALLAQASDQSSKQRMEATAELLAMGTVSPNGEPIEAAVRGAVLRELAEHGQKYGARLHIAAPGAPNGNVDLELSKIIPPL